MNEKELYIAKNLLSETCEASPVNQSSTDTGQVFSKGVSLTSLAILIPSDMNKTVFFLQKQHK